MTYKIYSRDGCPYCVKVQQVLQLAELNYEVYKLGQDFSREEFYEKFGQGSTFPRVVLGEELLGGCSETVKYLKEQKLV
jgi:glutaredoxin